MGAKKYANYMSYYSQAHEAILKQIQEDREQQKLRRQGHAAATTGQATGSTPSTSSSVEDKPPPEKKIDNAALLQVHVNVIGVVVLRYIFALRTSSFHG